MILFDFLEKVKPLGIFSVADIELLYPGLDRRRLFEWKVKGYIYKLRNEWYCLPDFLKEPFSQLIIANMIHDPSYISLETALSYYEIIPEGVYMTTSVTTGRPTKMEINKHVYVYSSFREELFTGYRLMETSYNSRKVKIANLEKAIADFFYFRSGYNTYSAIKALRWNGPLLRENLNIEKLQGYLEISKNTAHIDRVNKMINSFYNASS